MIGNYLRESVRVYFDNAQSVRDYRAQLRGFRPILLWFAYLSFLILVAMLIYAPLAARGGPQSVSSIQGSLQGFYTGLTALLASIVCLVAPGLTASAITIERQRRSLDLLFSAPVENRYLLVGKMISSLRYAVMLLVLSLPILSVCVVLGGATWQDVLQSFAILLLHTINFCAIGLLISAITTNVVSSIIWTYISCGGFVMLTAILSGPMLGRAFSPGSGVALNEAPWIVTLNPFFASYSGPTYTDFYGKHVPNWVFLLIFSIAFCKILVLGAGSYLSYYRSPETRSLRIHAMIYAAVFGALIGFPLRSLSAMAGSITSGIFSAPVPDYLVAVIFGVIALIGTLLLPQLSCFAFDEDRKYRPNGMWNLRSVLDGTPAGSAPFLIVLVLSFAVGIGAPQIGSPLQPGWATLSVLAWVAGLYFFLWAFGQYSASKAAGGLKGARTATLAMILMIVILPLPVVGAISAAIAWVTRSSPPNLMYAWYPYAIGTDAVLVAWAYGIAIALPGLWFLRKARELTEKNQLRYDAFHNPPTAVEPPPVRPTFDL